MPWWTRPLMFISVLSALIYSEKNAPIITRPVNLIWIIDLARKAPELLKKIEKKLSGLNF